MKFLRSCLCLCVTAVGVSQLPAQQDLTPDQQNQAREALRRALNQGAVASPAEAAPTLTPDQQESARQALRRALEQPSVQPASTQEQRIEQQRLAAPSRSTGFVPSPATKNLIAEEEKRAEQQRQAFEASRAMGNSGARQALRQALENPPTGPTAPANPAGGFTSPAVASGTTPAAPAQVDATRAALRQALDQPVTTPATVPPAETSVAAPSIDHEAVAKAARAAEAKAKADAAAAERKAKQDAIAAQKAADLQAKKDAADRVAAERKAKLDAKAKAEADKQALIAADRQAQKEAAERAAASAKAMREAQAKFDAEQKAAADAEKKKFEAEKQAAKVVPTAPVAKPQLPAIESKMSKSKSERLADLLEKYRKEQISPAEYHAERAKILAEPN